MRETGAMDVGGGHPSESPRRGSFTGSPAGDSSEEPEVVLRRVLVDGRERFAVVTPISYWDVEHDQPHCVPADTHAFRSDLTSVPSIFTWLVPRTGRHLLAAILHDGLVGCTATGPSYRGPRVTRSEADRIFRRALRAVGVSPARAWLMWTAVTLATIHAEAAAGGRRERLRWVAMVATLACVAGLGVVATGDLVDLWDLVPWMGERTWSYELASGAIAATVIPLCASLAWGRTWAAGAISGIALAWLLHVSALVTALAAAFALVERISEAVSVRMRSGGWKLPRGLCSRFTRRSGRIP